MKVEQYVYCGTEAMALRRRDGTPPWGVHPSEVDTFRDWPAGRWQALDDARALRDEIEREG